MSIQPLRRGFTNRDSLFLPLSFPLFPSASLAFSHLFFFLGTVRSRGDYQIINSLCRRQRLVIIAPLQSHSPTPAIVLTHSYFTTFSVSGNQHPNNLTNHEPRSGFRHMSDWINKLGFSESRPNHNCGRQTAERDVTWRRIPAI